MIMISNFLFNFFINFCVVASFFLTRLLTLDISFLTVLRAEVVAKLVILGISPMTSIILALTEALVGTLVISGIFSSIFVILALYTAFLTTYFFTTSLSLVNSTGIGPSLLKSNLFTFQIT